MSEPENKPKLKPECDNDRKVYSKNQLKLWISLVVIVNLVLLAVWLFTSGKDPDFASHFSFASSVTSIILSVLAIFMSVTSGSAMQSTRDRIELEADEITHVSQNLEKQIKELSGEVETVVQNTENIKAVINPHPGTAEVASASGDDKLKSFKS